MKKLLTILLVLISFSTFAQFEAGEYINSDTVKKNGVNLYLDHLKLTPENNGKIARQQGNSVVWGKELDSVYLEETDTSGIIDKDNFFWSANKKYELITPHIGGGTGDNVYMTNVNSDISGYKKTSYTNDTGITSFSVTASADTVLVQQFLFDGQLSTSILDAGGWIVRTYCNVSSIAGVSKFKYEFFVYDDADSTIFSFYSDEINNTAFQYNEYTSFQSAFNLGKSTYRLGIRVYFLTTLAASITGTFRVGDGETSYINTPIALRHERLRDKNGEENYLHINRNDQNAIDQYKIDSSKYVTYANNSSDLDLGANSISTDTVKIDGVPLLLNAFKQGSLGGAGNIFYSTGASSQPASGSLNQVAGGGLLTDKRLTRWDGSKFVNSGIIENVGYFSINQSELRFNENSNSIGYAGQLSSTTNQYSNNVGNYGQFNATTNQESNSVGHAGQQNATNNIASNNVGHAGQFSSTTNQYSNNVGNYGQFNATTNQESNNVGHAGQYNVTTNEESNNVGHAGQYNVTTNQHSNNVGYAGQFNATTNQYSNNLGSNGFRYSSTGLPVVSIIKGLSLGHNTKCLDTISTNEIVIGADAVGHGNNTATFGNMQITDNYFNGNLIADILKSRIPTGTPPLVVASSTKVDSLNVEFLDGKRASDFQLAGNYQEDSDTLTFDATLSDLADSTKYLKENAIGTISISVSGERLALNQNKVIGGAPVSDLIQRVTVDHDGLMTKDMLKRLTDTVPKLSGTLNYLQKVTGTNTLGNSFLYEDASFLKTDVDLKIGKVAPAFYLKDSHSNYSGFFYVYDSIFGIQKRDYATDAYISSPYGFSLDAPTNTIFTNNLGNTAFGHSSPLAKLHPISTTTQARLGYDENKYTDLSTGSTGNLTIDPTGDTVKVVGAVNSTGGFFKNGVEITGGGGINYIGMTMPTGLSVSPANLTANGTFAISYQPGYTYFTDTERSIYSNANQKRITSASFSGTTTKTLTLNQVDGGVLQASFTDLQGTSKWTSDTYGIHYDNNIGIGASSYSAAKIAVEASDNMVGVNINSTNYVALGAVATTGIGVQGISNSNFGGDFTGLGCRATKFYVSSLNTAPTSSTATGTTGEIRFTADYIYVCVATNTWKRTQISTW